MRARGVLAGCLLVMAAAPAYASGQDAPTCSRVVVVTLPGVTWREIRRVEPPHILAAVEAGAASSLAVRTIEPRTSYASGFATIGAGNRLEGGSSTGGPARDEGGLWQDDVRVAGVAEMLELAEGPGYGARPGALGSALGDVPAVAVGNSDLGMRPPTPLGYGRWALLAAMDRTGRVDSSATSDDLLRPDPSAPFGVRTDQERLLGAVDRALEDPCALTVVDQGDLVRADQRAFLEGGGAEDRARALLATDEVVERVRATLDGSRDLLLIVSPTSPRWEPMAHLGVGIAVGPGFAPGEGLVSASTRRPGIVTLPDVAPTILDHLGLELPPEMNGRPFRQVEVSGDRITAAVELDDESVFVEDVKYGISTGFVIFQVAVCALVIYLLGVRGRSGRPAPPDPVLRAAEVAALAVAAFPMATYLAGVVPAHELGLAWFTGVILALVAALVAAVSLAVRGSLDRLLVLTALTAGVLIADLVTGGRLQLNTVLGYSPTIAGRFAGAGNIAFAVLGASSLLTGALLVHRRRGDAGSLAAAGVLFVATVLVDGAPQFGSDVGGTVALVVALGVTWWLLSDRRVGLKLVLVAGAAAVAAVGLFLALDLARPPAERTHLGRLFEDVGGRGVGSFVDTLERKGKASLRVFTSTIWTYFVPPALLVMVLALRRPKGRWEKFASGYPRLRGGLIGGLVLAVVGFAVNDSGIVIPAVVLSFLVPTALLVHLSMERGEAPA